MNSKLSSLNEKPTHYVGIGASAGGLEALAEFFNPLPVDTGAAYIVVQHLSPDSKSMMPELLGEHTSMPIYQAHDGIVLEANRVYLIPARKNMLMRKGKLILSDKMPDANLYLPIDLFLHSLAEDQQHKAIGIVLSGTGSDGTRGIKALKELGGLVIVQEPGSAEFGGMPTNAYNTGVADLLLAPAEMGANLVAFIHHLRISNESSPLKYFIGDNDEILVEIFRVLEEQSSIKFSQYKATTVARRIERRLGINQLKTLDAYLRLLMDSPQELQILSKELLIGVTRFFRDDEAFAYLAKEIVPELVTRAVGRREGLRLWVAGCSTGEEAYSLAILFDEALRQRNIEVKVKIFATDVDADAIVEASSGVYLLDMVQDVSEERIGRYFVEEDGSYAVTQHLRQMVVFSTHNMIDDPPFLNIDMVSCRNVLIYFQYAVQKKVLSSMYFSLVSEGFLFLGNSESLGDLNSHFETLNGRKCVFKKTNNSHVPVGSTSPVRDNSLLAMRASTGMTPVATLVKPSRISGRNSHAGLLERLIDEYAPDCIVLNDSFDAIHVYGDVSAYTQGRQPGKITNNIKDMVIEDLEIAVSTALYRCEKNAEDVFYKDVVLKISDTENISIDLSIFYVKDSDLANAPCFYAVQFIKRNVDVKQQEKLSRVMFDVSEQSLQRIRDLELELVQNQEHLQVTIEELEATNEELQSTNEELMSANEELQSTNEELQSLNVELSMVSNEYQEKIGLLTEAKDDLDCVINATDIGIVFLDEQLAIRKFTPPSSHYIHLRNSDIDRPFYHISHELVYDEFLSDINTVSTHGEPIEKHIFSNDNHALLLRILPYRREGFKLKGGILITITNISRQRFVESALKKAQEQLRESLMDRSERLLNRVIKRSQIKLLLLDDDRLDRIRIRKYLNAIGDRDFKITECSEIDEAIECMSKSRFDICLMDYQLSEGTAKDVTQRIRGLKIATPIIVLSGYTEEGLDAEFLSRDIFDFLNKEELSGQLLCRSIDYVLERREVIAVLKELSEA